VTPALQPEDVVLDCQHVQSIKSEVVFSPGPEPARSVVWETGSNEVRKVAAVKIRSGSFKSVI
jgi:hypothetical protein